MGRNKSLLLRVLVSSIILTLLVSLSIPAVGLKRHGEDVGGIPLAIPLNHLFTLVDNSMKILETFNNSSIRGILGVIRVYKDLINNVSLIATLSNQLYEYLNNTSIPWISRFDYIEIALLASIEGVFNNTVIIDPVKFTMLLKNYEEERVLWAIDEISKIDPLLAEYIKEYNNANNTTLKNTMLNRIYRVLLKYADNGRIDILLLASEALNTTKSLGFTIDRIKLAEYINNTSRILGKYSASNIARIMRLMKTISNELYRGEISIAWQYFSLLKEEILKLNITISLEDSLKLSSLFSITGITINGVYVSLGALKTKSSVVADLLSAIDYRVRARATSIMAEIVKENRSTRYTNVDIQSFKIISNILAVNYSETNLGMLALRQPLSMREQLSTSTVNVVNPIIFIAIIALSTTMAGVILYSTIRVPARRTHTRIINNYFSETLLRRTKDSSIIIDYYVKALGILSSKGYPRFYWETPREHLLKIRSASCYEEFSVLVELYEKTVFGGERVPIRKEFLDELLERIEACT